MSRDRRSIEVRTAQIKAAKLVEEYGISRPEDIRLEDIAYDLGALVIEDLLVGAAARLLVTDRGSVIRVNTEEPYPYRKRFSIAHELGHLVLDHGHSYERVCTDENILDFNWNSKSEETQANAFAAEFLLPTALLKPKCDVAEVTFDPIRSIAEEFAVSLTATALRFVQYCPESCAVVFSQENKVKWFQGSEDWPFWIPVGSPLGRESVASRHFRSEIVPDEPIEVMGRAWIGDRPPDCLLEHSIASERMGFVLSILWMEPVD